MQIIFMYYKPEDFSITIQSKKIFKNKRIKKIIWEEGAPFGW